MDGTTPESALPQELTVGIASAKQRVEHVNARGERVAQMEVLEERAREIARLQMTEDRSKWEGRFPSLSTLTARVWRFGIGETATYTKEKNHAVKLIAESGIQMTTLPHGFVEQVDQLARQRIDANRSNRRGGRFFGRVRDFLAEASFREKDLHRERLAIVRELREAADTPNDPNRQQFLRNHPLGGTFSEIVKGDYQASESLAKRVSSQFGNEVIHAAAGERKTQSGVELQGPARDFFVNQVMEPLLREGLANGSISEASLMNARRQLQEFYFSPTFLDWYNTADQSIRDSLNLSLSYGTDLIPMIQETLLPQMLQMKEHMQATGNLESYLRDVVLKVQAGTLESGQKGTLGEGFAERHAAREITNQRVLDIYRNMPTRPQLVPDMYLSAARNRADLIGAITRVGTNSVLGGMLVGAGIYGARRLAGMAGNSLMPLVGGAAAAGAFRAMQERRTFTREFEEHNLEAELGYRMPQNGPRREQMRNLEFHKREMHSELTVPLQSFSERISRGEQLNVQEVNRLIGLLSETRARFDLMDQLDIGLLTARHPQEYQTERTNLELARAQAMVQLRTFIDGDPNRIQEVQRTLNLGGQNLDAIMTTLIQAQRDHLLTGTGLNPQYQSALGAFSRTQAESISQRDRAFRQARNMRTGLAFAGTFGSALVGGLVGQEALAGVKRLVGYTVGNTVLENVVHGVKTPGALGPLEVATEEGNAIGHRVAGEAVPPTTLEHWASGLLEGGQVIDQIKGLFDHSGQAEIAPHTFLRSDGAGHFDLIDDKGNAVSSPDVKIDENGKVIFKGGFNGIPQSVQDRVHEQNWTYSEIGVGSGFNQQQVLEMFNHPDPNGKLELQPGVFLQTDMDHHASLTDAAGHTIPTPPMFLTAEGHIVMDADSSHLTPEARHILDQLGVELRENNDPQYSTYHQIEQLMQENRHHTFTKGDLVFDINSGKDGQFSIMHYPSGMDTNGEPKVQIHGFIHTDPATGKPIIDVDRNFGSNKGLSDERWNIMVNELKKEGWQIDQHTITQPQTEVAMSDYFKEHGMYDQAHRDLWHDNNTPMHLENGKLVGADGKELQTYHHVLPDGRIDVDFSHMRSQILADGHGQNWDKTIDSQYGRVVNDISQNPDGSNSYKNFEVLVTPDKAADDAREAIIFTPQNHPELAQGHLYFDPNSPEAKAFFQFDAEGKPVMNQYGNFQKTSFMEVAHLQPDGSRTILSTTVGEGAHTITPPPSAHETYQLSPAPSATEVVPPDQQIETIITPEGIIEQDELFPLPLSYRKPIEAPITPERPTETIYYNAMYGSEPFSSEWAEQVARPGFSPNLRENPNYQPQPSQDTPWYLEQQLANPQYGSLLENLNNQEGTPMNPNCEAAVCLAVAGHQEHLNIYRTLQTYAVQTDAAGNSLWDSNKAEVVLLVNWPQGSSPDQTLAEIDRFRADFRTRTGRDFPLRLYRYEVTNGQKEVGLYKKMAFDLALLRKYQSNPTTDIQLIMNDADMTFSNPTYIDGILNEMNNPSNAAVDALLGRQDLDPEVYQKYPTFHSAMRFWQYMDSLSRAKTGLSYTQGRNTAIRGSVYAALGGNRTTEFWADIEFGNLLKAARGGRNTIKYSNRNWVMVDPRREVSKFMSGEPVSATWSDFNDSVRGNRINFGSFTDVDVDALQSDPNVIGQFETRIKNEFEMILRDIFQIQPDGTSPSAAYYAQMFGLNRSAFPEEIMQRALGFMGVRADVTFVDENVRNQWRKVPKITFHDTSTLRTNLKRYRDEQRYNAKIKTNPLFGQPKTP